MTVLTDSFIWIYCYYGINFHLIQLHLQVSSISKMDFIIITLNKLIAPLGFFPGIFKRSFCSLDGTVRALQMQSLLLQENCSIYHVNFWSKFVTQVGRGCCRVSLGIGVLSVCTGSFVCRVYVCMYGVVIGVLFVHTIFAQIIPQHFACHTITNVSKMI